MKYELYDDEIQMLISVNKLEFQLMLSDIIYSEVKDIYPLEQCSGVLMGTFKKVQTCDFNQINKFNIIDYIKDKYIPISKPKQFTLGAVARYYPWSNN